MYISHFGNKYYDKALGTSEEEKDEIIKHLDTLKDRRYDASFDYNKVSMLEKKQLRSN